MNATVTRDYEPWEVASAAVVALAIQIGAGVMFYVNNDRLALVLEVDRTNEVPVKVTPVIDTEMITARAGGKAAKLPDMWQRAPASVKKAVQETPPPPEVAAPSPKADDTTEAVPDKDRKVATVEDAGPPIDAGEPGADAGIETSLEDSGAPTLDEDGGTSNAADAGCQGPGCTPDGGLDRFQEAQYLGRIISFFRRGFVVHGLGLPPDEIKQLSVSVSVTLSGVTVSSFTMTSSGNATFDGAARAAMQGKVGQQVPPPPEDRPDLQRSNLSFQMTCSSACN